MSERQIEYFKRYVLPQYITKPSTENRENYLIYLKKTKADILKQLRAINTEIAEIEYILERA